MAIELTPILNKIKFMEQQLINAAGALHVSASEDSSSQDFDFLLGKWKIHNRKLKTRLGGCTEWLEFEAAQECRKILNGFANTDNFQTEFDGEPFEGMALRLFNPKTKLWSIYWADSNAVVLDVPQVGSFDGDIGRFYAKDVFDGREIIVQYLWDKSNANVPIWSQAFSEDDGETWEWNWRMTMTRG